MKDIYAGFAAKFAGIAEMDVTPEQRRAAKAAAFPHMYGKRPVGKDPALAMGYGEAPMHFRTTTITHVAMGGVVEEEVELGDMHWRCSDGRVVCPEQMTDQHKLNCLRMVARSRLVRTKLLFESLGALRYASTAPDGAADAANEAAVEMLAMSYETRMREAVKASPVLGKMAAILKKRGVDVFVDPEDVLADGDPIPRRSLQRPLPGRRRRRGGQGR